nr:hypothetical protein [Mixta intestinalis]
MRFPGDIAVSVGQAQRAAVEVVVIIVDARIGLRAVGQQGEGDKAAGPVNVLLYGGPERRARAACLRRAAALASSGSADG